MILKFVLDEHAQDIDIPDHILTDATDFFEMVDADLDKGYQMGRYWKASPDTKERCQIAADKILTSLETGKTNTVLLLAAYIVNKMPNAIAVHLTSEGDMTLYDIETS